jgi:hypothetical protein
MPVNKMEASKQVEKTWYVYALVRPDTVEIFYIGKGSVYANGIDRIDRHEEEARKGERSKKSNTIRELWVKGLQVQKCKLYETDSEADAMEYERALIMLMNANGNLANILYGGEPNRRFRSIIGRAEARRIEQRQGDFGDLVHFDNRITVSRTLREYRIRLGWSINKLAQEAAIVRQAAANAEAGQPIRADTAKALADALSRGYGREIDVLEIQGLNIL